MASMAAASSDGIAGQTMPSATECGTSANRTTVPRQGPPIPWGPAAGYRAHPLKSRRRRDSARRQHVDDAARDHLLRLSGVSRHVWRRGMRLKGFDALPLFHHDVGIGSELGLDAARPLGVD